MERSFLPLSLVGWAMVLVLLVSGLFLASMGVAGLQANDSTKILSLEMEKEPWRMVVMGQTYVLPKSQAMEGFLLETGNLAEGAGRWTMDKAHWMVDQGAPVVAQGAAMVTDGMEKSWSQVRMGAEPILDWFQTLTHRLKVEWERVRSGKEPIA